MSSEIEAAVRAKYESVARSGLSTERESVRSVAEAFGYTAEELFSIPAEANLGVQCGNPTATASLKPGEVVVDLGSGGGLDVFLAARKVGRTGRVIGIDMTPAMIELGRRNAAKARDAEGQPLTNVEFHLATIESMPLADGLADCVISNCVLNLVPDKPAAFREIARVLKPGGRLAASDIALKKPLPPELSNDLMAYVGCIAGAIPIEEYVSGLREAGFSHVEVVDTGADLNVYAKIENQVGCCGGEPATIEITSSCSEKAGGAASSCCGPAAGTNTPELLERLAELLRRYNINEYAASVRVYAVKPA